MGTRGSAGAVELLWEAGRLCVAIPVVQLEKLRDREKQFASQPGAPNETRGSSWASYLPAHSQRPCGFTFSLPQFSFYRKKQ